MSERYTPGAVLAVAYPFVREATTLLDEEGPYETETWRPGTRFAPVPPDYSESVADAMGEMQITIVSTHKPGRFPTRVFYTREWVDPDGKRFGKPKLHTATAATVTRMLNGYRHWFRLLEPSPN